MGQQGGLGMGYGMGVFGNNQAANGGAGASPPRQENVPMTPVWQHQLMRAEVGLEDTKGIESC